MPQFIETLYQGYGQVLEQSQVLFEKNTGIQQLVIFHNPVMGNVMALDGIIQTTEKDEFIYHEMLTHVPMLSHAHPRRVLIIGGGDGGILREVLRHPTVEQAIMVEIDAAVIDMAKRWFPHHSAGAFDDPRAQILIDDGVKFVNETSMTFDVIISDSTDPCGPGEVLFSSDFYTAVRRCLTPGGIFVAQNGVPFLQLHELLQTAKRFAPLFSDSGFYTVAVPTYIGGVMTLAWGACEKGLRNQPLEVIAERYNQRGLTTRYYTPAMHLASFALPAYVEAALAQVDG